MREWAAFFVSMVIVTVSVVAAVEQSMLGADERSQLFMAAALISEVGVLCVSAQIHVWRMLRAVVLFFYWPVLYLAVLALDHRSWLNGPEADAAAITLICVAAIVGIAIGLFWYLVSLAQSSATPRIVMHRGRRYRLKEDARGPYLEPVTSEYKI